LLFWLTNHQLGAERNIGGFELPDTPERYPRNYVLDGQQRLTTLYAVLKHPASQLEERLRVVYDLIRGEFSEAKEPLAPTQLPLNLLYDTNAFWEFRDQLREREDGPTLIAESQRLWETFQNYVIPVVTVQDAPIEKVGIIFERINSRGTRLTLFDLMVAATWGAEAADEFNLRDSIETVLRQLDDKDYGEVEDVSILRSLAVVNNNSARRQVILGLRELDSEDLQLLIERTRAALSRAVDFLVSQVSAVSGDFLPYERQLILLAYVMASKPSLSADNINLLKRWFWRTSFAQRYRAGGEALFDDDLEAALTLLEEHNGLDRFGQAPHKSFFVRAQFRKGAAASQAFATL
jgi:hypothetical protein